MPAWDWPGLLVRDWARARVWLRLWSGRLMAWLKGWVLVALEEVPSAWLEVSALEAVPSAEPETGVLEEVAELAAQSLRLTTSFAELSPDPLANDLPSESESSLEAEL